MSASMERHIKRQIILENEDRPSINFFYSDPQIHPDALGYAHTYIKPEDNILAISYVEVAHKARARGIGRAILHSIKDLAHEIDVDAITARIVSRESLAMMTHVFGEDAISVRTQGEFGFHERGFRTLPITPASAWLKYDITKEPLDSPDHSNN